MDGIEINFGGGVASNTRYSCDSPLLSFFCPVNSFYFIESRIGGGDEQRDSFLGVSPETRGSFYPLEEIREDAAGSWTDVDQGCTPISNLQGSIDPQLSHSIGHLYQI